MKFISAREWGANPSKDATEDSHPVGSTLGVTLHWEGPHMGDFPHSQCARKVRSIERFHEYGRGWGDIAYNLLVCPHGYVFEGRGAGVRSAANGTSNIGGNDQWYAVCYLGGQGDGFTAAGKQGMADAVAYLRSKGAGPRVNGHRDHHPTECPGNEIYRWLKRTNFTKAANQSEEDDDMPLSDKDIDRIAYSVWAKEIGGGDNRVAARLHMIWASNASREAARRVRNQLGDIKAAVERNADKSEIQAMLDDLSAEVEGATVQLELSDEEK